MFGPLLMFALSVPVEITGDGDCPSAVAVNEALEPLLASSTSSSREQVKLSRRNGRVVVELATGAGEAPVVRDIDGNALCADLARAVAVIVAAWQLERHPEQRRVAPAFRPPQPVAPSPVTPEPAAPPPQAAPRLELGLGFASAVDTDGASPAAVLRSSVLSAAGWGLTLWGGGPRGRTEDLLGGRVEWFRPVFVAALTRRSRLGPALNLDLSLGPAAAWLMAQSTELPGSRRVSSWTPGATAGARVSYGEPVGVWLAVDGVAWLRSTQLVVEPAAASLSLPTWELWAAAGVLVRWSWNGG